MTRREEAKALAEMHITATIKDAALLCAHYPKLERLFAAEMAIAKGEKARAVMEREM